MEETRQILKNEIFQTGFAFVKERICGVIKSGNQWIRPEAHQCAVDVNMGVPWATYCGG